MSHEWCPRVDCTKENVSSIPPYADISGNGVVIGFFGTAYFVLLLVIADYVLALDPDEDPFQTYAKHRKPSGVVRWHPNPVDDRLLKSFRKTWHLPLNGSRRFRAAFNEFFERTSTLCYFKQDTGTFRKGDKAQQDQEWQAMVLSVFLLFFGFVSRSVKLFRPLSASLRGKLRHPVGSWVKKMLRNLAKPHSSNAHLESLRTKLVFKPILAAFFMFRLSFDLYSSTLFEILPVILLIGPLFTTIGFFVFHFTTNRPSDPVHYIELNVIDETGQRREPETIALQRRSHDLEDNQTSTAEQVSTPGSSTTGAQQAATETHGVIPDQDTQNFLVPDLDNYREALWLPVCVVSLFFNVLGATLIAFSTMFYYSAETAAYRLSPVELWISKFGFIYLVLYVQISDIGFHWVFYFTGLEMMAAMYILHALTLCGKEFAARTLKGRRIVGFLSAWFSR
ncbi:hypothetical protein K456DRAFT_1936041 [Colletotrichum gloeosporioides 23]|nr:hypothetical protein K456DRAFT_1936041 [Colletotrichum gloeosporioides 23]